MKKLLMILVTFCIMLTVSYANEVNLDGLDGYLEENGNKKIVDMKSFNGDENLTLVLTPDEIDEMEEEGIYKLEINMQHLKFRIKIKELVDKGKIRISSEYKDDLYYVKVHSSICGYINEFDSKVEILIPYDMDEESYYITMFGVDENEQIINFRGFMLEETKEVLVRIKTIEFPLIPVVNKIIYKDLGEYSWAKEYIEESAAKGLLTGKEEGIYAPDENVTRAEFVTLLVKALDLELVEKTSNFIDVSKEDWFHDYIVTAESCGLISEIDSDKFNPESSITRQDIVIMVGKALEKFYDMEIEDYEYKFIDAEDINQEAVSYLKKCLAMNLVSGYEDDTFSPDDYAKRAEAAVIINKLFNKINGF